MINDIQELIRYFNNSPTVNRLEFKVLLNGEYKVSTYRIGDNLRIDITKK